MTASDEKIRDAVNDGLTQANVDVRNLAIESVGGHLIVKGTVPSTDQQEGTPWESVATTSYRSIVTSKCIQCRRPTVPTVVDGRQRQELLQIRRTRAAIS